MTETLLRGGFVFDLERGLERADLLVADGRISRVEPGIGVDVVDGVEVLDVTGDVVIPGLVNAHTHSNQYIEKGLCDTLPLDSYLVLASYGGAGARLTPRDLYVSTMVSGLEMIRTGTTAVLDCARTDLEWFDEGMDAIMQAYADLGLRASVATQFSDLDFFSSIPVELVPGGAALQRPPRATPAEVLARVEAFVHRWRDRSPLLEPMLGPSSLPRCSIELFESAVSMARDLGARMQTHLLSAKSQALLGAERYGGSTVAFLERVGCLAPWASFAHSIWLDDAEIKALAASGAVAVHNPASNMKLGAGVAPVPAMLAAGVKVALGADGASSNDSQNMFETTKLAALLSRVTTPIDRWVSGRDALGMCWHGGASAMDRPLGRIVPGAAADLVVLAGDAALRGPSDVVINRLAFAELGQSVRTVLVGGEVVLRDGRVTTVDEAALRAEADDIAARIWATLPQRLAKLEEMTPTLAAMERAVAAMDLGVERTCAL